MFPNGLSTLTHAFILLLALAKRLIEFAAEKMRWDIFRFKMNLYLRLKLGAPLTSRAGDSWARRAFSYMIVLVVSASVILTMFISVGSRLTKDSNIDFALNLFGGKSLFAKADEDAMFADDYLVPARIAHLPSEYGSLPDDGAFVQGFVSLNFDDGWLVTYKNALPILNKAGLKSTQYVITSGFDITSQYMSRSQVLQMQADGHEIGNHSKSHLHLSQLTDGRKKNEIIVSKEELADIGVASLKTYDYVHGEYSDLVRNLVKNAGFSGARTIDPGFNTRNTDPFLLKAKVVEVSTTVDQVKSWIDEAVSQRKWLILVFHQIDKSGKKYSTKPETFQQVVDYLVKNNVPVKTNAEGIEALGV